MPIVASIAIKAVKKAASIDLNAIPAITNITRRVSGNNVLRSHIETSVKASVNGTPPET